MADTPTNRLQECSIAWKTNRKPTKPNQFDQVMPILGDHGQPSGHFARVRWNPLRDRYEMDPVEEVMGTYQPVTLVMDKAAYRTLHRHLTRLGVMHTIRVHEKGKEPVERPTTLPASLFPRLVKD